MSVGLLKSTKARDQILGWIREGKVAPGERLPSERELAAALSVDHRTVRRGLEDLVRSGVIIKRPRVGNFLKESAPPELVTQIALALPDWLVSSAKTHPLISLMHQGISRALPSDKYSISTFWYQPERFWVDAGQSIVDRGFDGAMVFPAASPLQSIRTDVRRLMDSGVKVVSLDYGSYFEGLDCFSVSFNDAYTESMRQLFYGLADRGHRRIVAALYKPSIMFNVGRDLAAEFASKYGISDPSSLLLEIPSDGYHADNNVFARVLDQKPRPTAMIVPDEFAAAVLFRCCYERGISIPDDLSIAAIVDNTPHVHSIPLTAPRSAALRVEASEQAARTMALVLQGGHPAMRRVEYNGDVEWRASVAPVPGSGSPAASADKEAVKPGAAAT